MRQITCIDITGYSFEEFVQFVFDREVPVEAETPTAEERSLRWYHRTEAVIDVRRLSSHYVRLFIDSANLLEMFSRPQLQHGFSAIESKRSFSVNSLIWNIDLAFEQRAGIVKSMFYLFRDFFSVEPLGYTANMWWDGLCYCWEIGQKRRSRGGDDSAMQDVMFGTMSDLLSIDSDECRYAALHGLSHLHHPATLELIQRYRPTLPYLAGWCNEYQARETAWGSRLQARRFRLQSFRT